MSGGGIGVSMGTHTKTLEGRITRDKIHEIITDSFALRDYGNAVFIKSVLFDLLDRMEELELQSLQTKVSGNETLL